MRERSIPSCSSLYTQGMSPGKCSRTKSQIQCFSVTSTLCAVGNVCWKSQSVPDLVQKQQPYTASKDPGENLRKAHWYLSPWALCSHHKTSDLSHAGLTNPMQDAGDMQRCCCLVTKSCSTLHDPMDCSMPGSPVLHHLPEFAQIHGHWVSDAISSSVNPFSFCLQWFPASGSFPMSRLFASSGQSIATSASTSVLPMNVQCWLPLGLLANNPPIKSHSSVKFSGGPAIWSFRLWLCSPQSKFPDHLEYPADLGLFRV